MHDLNHTLFLQYIGYSYAIVLQYCKFYIFCNFWNTDLDEVLQSSVHHVHDDELETPCAMLKQDHICTNMLARMQGHAHRPVRCMQRAQTAATDVSGLWSAQPQCDKLALRQDPVMHTTMCSFSAVSHADVQRAFSCSTQFVSQSIPF